MAARDGRIASQEVVEIKMTALPAKFDGWVAATSVGTVALSCRRCGADENLGVDVELGVMKKLIEKHFACQPQQASAPPGYPGTFPQKDSRTSVQKLRDREAR